MFVRSFVRCPYVPSIDETNPCNLLLKFFSSSSSPIYVCFWFFDDDFMDEMDMFKMCALCMHCIEDGSPNETCCVLSYLCDVCMCEFSMWYWFGSSTGQYKIKHQRQQTDKKNKVHLYKVLRTQNSQRSSPIRTNALSKEKKTKYYTHKHRCNPCGCGCFDHDGNDLIGFYFIGFNSRKQQQNAGNFNASILNCPSIQTSLNT